jgi:hypothetical protein
MTKEMELQRVVVRKKAAHRLTDGLANRRKQQRFGPLAGPIAVRSPRTKLPIIKSVLCF